jgi:serine/threonine-protein kinase
MADASPQAELAALAVLLAGQYEVEREIGRGGMGIVYRARDVKLERPVAIKVLPPHLASIAAVRDRFLREARTAAKLSHPSIVPVHRADEIDGTAFFVMALVDGGSLGERIRGGGPLSPASAVPILAEVARALAYAHTRGVVHRDIKPENILLDADSGRAMVTDFGIARLADASPLTATGQVLGTVHFMSPEQISGDAVDGRSDLYSLGVVGYLTLSGLLPFDSDNATAVLVAHVTKPPPRLADVAPHVSPPVAAVIDAVLAKDPAARYGTGDAMADALEAALASGATSPPLLREDAARALWARAADLQAMTGVVAPPPVEQLARGGATSSPTNAYRLDEVRAAALEAGIDARHLDRAAADLGIAGGERLHPAPAREAPALAPAALDAVEDQSPDANIFAGAPMSVQLEIRIPGEVREEEFEYLVEIIRQELDDAGHVGTLGRTLTWSSSNKQRQARVSIMPRGGETIVRAGERMGHLAGAIFGGVMGGGGGGLTGPTIAMTVEAFHSAPITLAAVGTVLATVYGVARTAFVLGVRRRERVLRRLLARLAAEIERANETARPRLPGAAAPLRLPR